MTPHITVFTCNACEDMSCEVTSERAGFRPTECPLGMIPEWVPKKEEGGE